MELTLQRQDPTQHSTPSQLTGITGYTFECLEPPPVPDPAYDNCPVSIPAGRYQLKMEPSATFSRILGKTVSVPVYQNVPGRPPYHPQPFVAVELHFGNTVEAPGSTKTHPIFNTEACTMAGDSRSGPDEILNTRDACINHIWPAIAAAEAAGQEVWITVSDPTS